MSGYLLQGTDHILLPVTETAGSFTCCNEVEGSSCLKNLWWNLKPKEKTLLDSGPRSREDFVEDTATPESARGRESKKSRR